MGTQSGHLVQAYVDGACVTKNPGGIPVWGFLLLRDNTPIDTKGGLAAAESSPQATNNVAEYEAFIYALKEIKHLGWDQDKIVVYTDSLILHNQLKDEWKVGPELFPWYKKAKALMNGFPFIEMRKISRSQNRVAHRAAKAAYYEVRFGAIEERIEMTRVRLFRYEDETAGQWTRLLVEDPSVRSGCSRIRVSSTNLEAVS